MKMNDNVKYQLEKAEDALRTALSFSEKESVYVISAISKALIEIDNTMFAERIEESSNKEKNELNNSLFKWNNTTSFIPSESKDTDGL